MERRRRNPKNLTKEMVAIVRLIGNVHRYMQREYEMMQQKDPNADLSQYSNTEQRTAEAVGVELAKIRPMLVSQNLLETIDIPALMRMKPNKKKIEIAVEVTVESKTDSKVEVAIVPKNTAHFASVEHKFNPN
ncbi:hypothetical protein PYW08_000337 [Mythimna loreyi]|uniref:Uncharacterized protein n=1 Tax=Mythimna loreyi TaxID=667449 RepID=A0ACC2RC71_9NEOP|nr:hypothetical protein PYW08_000337 [Mythimna loreyi]